ncbi:DNA-protecting protein DprA [Candidatus Jorgensenbacteria bacterium CG_4_10_14_0_8_um_filter_39_13]|uniref:DNA-protecting protein DprA n=2 Tax=Candidatus Joergenseniibacteriota TaxID=1752739 RepID=A0A2M7RHH7_9BACT|nr:MAG: DNA-protecting protein DprA [Candidatus Jorgensenbacteria bacterium CG11_big_fil_rev_8_21_14_0_20_38_23]PIV13185.1 MAG: DNA-protecting protein DprA [Candidatus Jorgensenbacteria bacterium CG03_land_8_20_14_0_80_38_39]PIW97602.1 MAG: DNA-protecting protein DprA [Candidatus Jorgensenbacteria bacterium CG_4_8_14_3_um_filter_38_10]PIY96022.1 MAG: DNA-protecting protein DprA [Candidatus Jorgensenbacteria bacterium CG_4_10_14_0_8_um_filter_39_13]PJA94826.1 MAG: DNA-protecting protein DprA [Ca
MAIRMKKLNLNDPLYPSLLKYIPQPPKMLYFLGELPNDEIPKIAIVGTRKATTEGKLIAKKIAYDLSEMGIIIVSGLALGIDAAAHQGAVRAQAKTIAVLANGLDEIYPRQNANLAQEILSLDGAIISEYPPGTPAYPEQFLARNRIISGLSLATLIVEAPIHSGSLVTARYALEQGREVFIVPGPVNHSNYEGSHFLLREGGRLVTKAEDVIEDLNLGEKLKTKVESSKNDFGNDEITQKILDSLGLKKGGLTIDEIIKNTNLEPQVVNQSLTFLIFKGRVKERLGKYSKIK